MADLCDGGPSRTWSPLILSGTLIQDYKRKFMKIDGCIKQLKSMNKRDDLDRQRVSDIVTIVSLLYDKRVFLSSTTVAS